MVEGLEFSIQALLHILQRNKGLGTIPFMEFMKIQQAIYGLEEDLLGADSHIWNCTNCYNCYERCPQEVHPIEVIIALKNMTREKGTQSPAVDNILQRVNEKGVTVTSTEMIKKRRTELGLPDYEPEGKEEIEKLLKS